MDLDFAADGNLKELSGEEAWDAIENFDQGQKGWDNPQNIISEQEVANLKAQAKILFGNENVWVEMHRGISWDKVENPDPQSTSQVLLSIKEYTPPVTYPKEVEETIGIPIKVEPFVKTPLEDLGLNTCNHDIPLSSNEIPSFDEPEPQFLPNFSPLDVNLGDKKGTDPLIKPHSPDSFRIKEVEVLRLCRLLPCRLQVLR
nr:ribonuclease H-like domain-containing protein [Tanacetum cinerariifolium]